MLRTREIPEMEGEAAHGGPHCRALPSSPESPLPGSCGWPCPALGAGLGANPASCVSSPSPGWTSMGTSPGAKGKGTRLSHSCCRKAPHPPHTLCAVRREKWTADQPLPDSSQPVSEPRMFPLSLGAQWRAPVVRMVGSRTRRPGIPFWLHPFLCQALVWVGSAGMVSPALTRVGAYAVHGTRLAGSAAGTLLLKTLTGEWASELHGSFFHLRSSSPVKWAGGG